MLICEHCGKIYDEDDVGCHYEEHGERRSDGCRCGGELVEAVECPVCGEYIEEEDCICGVCYEEGMTIENAIKYGEEQPIDIPINEFVANVLSVKEINDILIEYIYDNYKDKCKEVRDYFELDVISYEDFIAAEFGR